MESESNLPSDKVVEAGSGLLKVGGHIVEIVVADSVLWRTVDRIVLVVLLRIVDRTV